MSIDGGFHLRPVSDSDANIIFESTAYSGTGLPKSSDSSGQI